MRSMVGGGRRPPTPPLFPGAGFSRQPGIQPTSPKHVALRHDSPPLPGGERALSLREPEMNLGERGEVYALSRLCGRDRTLITTIQCC